MSIISKIIWGATLLGSTLLMSCTATEENQVLKAKEFKTAIVEHKDAVLLDVRTAEEFGNGHIENAVNIDWNKGEANFEEQLKNVPKDKKILVYCQGGSRSATAAAKLRDLGYKQVQELDGGIVAWNTEFGATQKPASSGMTMNDFNAKIKTDKVVLVDFNAEWCPPCQKMKPFLYDIQKTRKEEVEVVFIDTDKNPDIANMFRIEGLPTLMIYKDGVKQWHHVGYMDKESLLKEIETYKK